MRGAAYPLELYGKDRVVCERDLDGVSVPRRQRRCQGRLAVFGLELVGQLGESP